jgi:hypothetical protein
MGGGGFLGLGPAPSAPAAPDYTAAAKETAAGNLDAARAATAANRVNQITPYGNLDYTISGQDPYGNPTWTAKTSLSDVGQQLLNNQNNTSLGLGSAINAQLGQVQNVMGQGFNPNIPQTQTSLGNQGGMAGWDKANALLMQRLQPQMDIQQKTLDAKLANQGVVAGTEAYNRAKMGLGMQQNDLLNQSQLTGLQAGQTLFNQGLQGAQFGNQAQQQAYNQALTNYNMPLNTLSALRTGAQVQNPTFQNAPQQATTAGADLLGAASQQYNAAMGGFNAQQAAQSNLNSGLMGLGGTLGAAALMAPAASDIRMKENITQVYWLPNGLPVYTYEYKPEFKDDPYAGHGVHIGVMAQEVEQVMPEAVITRADGYKMVDYGVINA